MAQRIKSGVTVASTVTTVTFSTWYNAIEVLNSGGFDIWMRTDGIDPTISGDDCILIPSQTWKDTIPNDQIPASNTIVKMISATATNYTVEGRTHV
jgi:hypothetical protein